ncbi:MAG: hypothetical protein AB8H80_11740 [Planctomycetota bacterium]
MKRMLMSASLALLAVPTDGLAQQEAPTKQAAPKAETRAQVRERRLQAAVDEMVVLVEKYAELKFEKRPTVRAATHAQWRELIKKEMEPDGARELMELTFGTLGLYLAEVDEVVLSPLVVAPLVKPMRKDPPRHVRLAVAQQKATVVHELVHALQQARFGLPASLQAVDDEDVDEILRHRFLVEGHAVFVEERIAEQELGLKDFWIKGAYGLWADPAYVTGRRFFLHVFHAEGMAGVHERLKRPPSLKQIVGLAKRKLPEARAEVPEKSSKESSRRADGGEPVKEAGGQ